MLAFSNIKMILVCIYLCKNFWFMAQWNAHTNSSQSMSKSFKTYTCCIIECICVKRNQYRIICAFIAICVHQKSEEDAAADDDSTCKAGFTASTCTFTGEFYSKSSLEYKFQHRIWTAVYSSLALGKYAWYIWYQSPILCIQIMLKIRHFHSQHIANLLEFAHWICSVEPRKCYTFNYRCTLYENLQHL